MLDPLVNPSVPIAGAVAFLGLALLVARRVRRRRQLARLAREQEESRVNISRGNLGATALPDLMRTIAEYRASGMLELTAPAESFSLYFLFGRIFHAVGPALEGEAALGRALRLNSRGPLALLLVGALLLLLGALALSALRRVEQTIAPPAQPCLPAPCAAPNGFEAYFSNIHVSGEDLTIDVRFKNQTSGGFEAVSYRHTSPADFQLRGADGHQSPPRFSQTCPSWPELRVERGASAGPVTLCFPAPAGDYHRAQLIWSPDLGLLFDDVRVPLK